MALFVSSRPLSATFARAVTEALAPAVLVAAIGPLVAWRAGSTGWGVFLTLFAAVVPLAFILRGVRSGRYVDHHVGNWRDRPVVLLVTLASVVAALVVMLAFDAPRDLVALVVAMLAGLGLVLAVTALARWKVSMHSAVAAGTVTTLALVLGPWLNLAWLLAALVAWSRVRLGDHTTGQVLVGTALGAAAAGIVFPLLR